MGKNKQPAVHKVPNRVGEGVAVAVLNQRSVVGVNGTTGVVLSLDLSDTPVPERKYVASVASVIAQGDAAQILFGQKKVASNDLRSLVVVHLNAEAIHRFFKSAPEILKLMDTMITNLKVPPASLYEFTSEPAQTAEVAASIIVASVSGRDACVDFYYSSPFVAVQVSRGGKFVADPVARVILPMNLWRSVCAKLDNIRGSLPEESSGEPA